MDNRDLRAPKKKYFKIEYATAMNVLDSLSIEELGEYFKAITEYELYGIEPESLSDRTVQMAFRMTARELDYQLEKHFGNQQRGRENRKGKEKEEESTNLREELSKRDIARLASTYDDPEDLIATIQEQLDENCTTVNNPMKYIEEYAKATGWKRNAIDDLLHI